MPRLPALILAGALALAPPACKPKEADGPADPRASAVAVDTIVLQQKPVRDTSEYLATLSSRSSVTLYPQVIGHVSAILVKPGDRVKAGAALVQIDPSQQQATLEQLVAAKKLKEANLRFAGERQKRAATMAEQGLMSRQDFEQASSERDAAEADVKAADAQIGAQASQLRFFRLISPFDGVVGDIPVKIGDLVTTQTKVTTVGQNALLEAYVNVPVERAADLGEGSRVELLDARGMVIGESPVTFVAEQANVDTQSVLIKGAFPNATSLKAAQLVRARVVWSTRPGLRLPTTAVMRQSGQTFAYIAAAETAGAVARQRAITLGAVDGNDFVVVGGLAVGDRVITSGVQKLRDGAPVNPAAESSSAAPTPTAPKG
jgi:RND family efflux transporter MFP subunit